MKSSTRLAVGGLTLFAAGAAVSHFFVRPTVEPASAFAGPEVIPPRPVDGEIAPPRARVNTLQGLQDAMAAAEADRFRCDRPYVIWVDNDASIDLDSLATDAESPNFLLRIPDCVTLASGRSATVDGGLLFVKGRPPHQVFMLAMGNGSRVSGLRLQGPSTSSDSDQVGNGAILVEGIDRAIVENDEISAWPAAAVTVNNVTTDQSTVQQIRVTNSFLHDNVMCGAGYGVVIGHQGYALVDRNLFDDNRHAVSGDGCVFGHPGCQGNTGYVAELNFVMAEGAKCPSSNWFARLFGAAYYNQHFDMHGLGPGCGSESHCGGPAGQFFDIRHNAIRGNQNYYNFGWWGRTRPALELRGTPDEESFFRDNAVAHDNQGDAIKTPANDPQPNLQVSNIQYHVDTSNELAVGDFDGDGCADVFQATGAVWVYAPCGRREWRFLNQSSIRLSGLAFGDFDADGRTDVFTQEGSQWLVSYGGTGPWTPLAAGSNIPMKGYAFADFDRDDRTDIFETNGQEWFFSSAGATPWTHLNFSKLGVKDLRFGHFNPRDPKETDVFAVVNDQWSISLGGRSKWQRLNAKLSDSVADLVLGDFNGDGITDIAYGLGNQSSNTGGVNGAPQLPGSPTTLTWYVSWSGSGPWTVLRSWTPVRDEIDPPLTRMLIGDFNHDTRADVLGQMKSTDGLTYFFWSSGGAAPLTQRSVYTVQ
jgi:hypothetical protein